ncbi:MAG: protein kinase [Planctomycetes bacterium]|nr:protein kinase [Planctomycetota bacterium]
MLAKVSVRTAAGTKDHSFPADQPVVVGRSADCDLVVDEVSVSRRHCSLIVRGDVLVVNDLQSAHGLVHERQRVSRCELPLGGSVRIGAAQLRFAALGERRALPAALAEEGDATAGSRSAEAPAALPAGAPAVGPEPAARQAGPATPPAGPGDDLLGQTLGGYRVMSLLGTGGAAVVYRAEQIQLAREVALKVLRIPPDGEEQKALPAFLREARAAAALADPRLVQVFDFGSDRGLHFLSMELVRGGSLQERLRRDGRVPWQELLPILRDVVAALGVAHAAGLVHRDVKPANILLCGQGRAKLADLGLVRDIGGEADRAGTAAFMAPEQIRSQKLDGRTDLYALGCTAYAALAGRPPFAGSTKEILKGHRDQEPPPLPAEAVVPPELERLVRTELMAKDPALRPRDCAAVLLALERIERFGFQGPRRPGASRIGRGGQRSSALGPVLFLLLVVAVGVTAVVLLRGQ